MTASEKNDMEMGPAILMEFDFHKVRNIQLDELSFPFDTLPQAVEQLSDLFPCDIKCTLRSREQIAINGEGEEQAPAHIRELRHQAGNDLFDSNRMEP